MGKSIIIADIAIIAYLQYKNLGKIYIVFSSEILRDSDRQVYDNLKRFMPNAEVELYVGMEGAVKVMQSNDLMIIDEADYQLIDLLNEMPDKNCKVIAMSATSFRNEGGLEEDYLKWLNFKVYDSFIEKRFSPDDPLHKVTKEDFFDKSSIPGARLIFCDPSEEENYRSEAARNDFEPLVNHDNTKDLRQIRPN